MPQKRLKMPEIDKYPIKYIKRLWGKLYSWIHAHFKHGCVLESTMSSIPKNATKSELQ